MVWWWRIDALPWIPTTFSSRPRGRKWANPSKESSRLNTHEELEPSPASPAPAAALHVLSSTMWMVLKGVKKRKGEAGRRLFLRFWLREALWGLWPSPLRAPLRGPQLQDGGGVEPIWTIHICQRSPSSFEKPPEADPSPIEGLGGSNVPSMETWREGGRNKSK